MGLTSDDLRALLAAFEASEWQEMTVDIDGDRLHVSRRAAPSPLPPVGPAPPPAAVEAASPPAVDGHNKGGGHVRTDAPASAPSPGVIPTRISGWEEPQRGTPVTAPSVGVFWRAPSPGAPPFVEVGTRVGPEDTIGILEIMKLMKPVPAGVAGVVTAILADNGATVEHGDPLVLVDAEA